MDPNVLFYWVLIPIIKIALVFAILPGCVALFTWLERKIIAFMQVRLGPMRVGIIPHGLLQPIADVLKLLIKEDIVPSRASKFVFTLAPVLSVVPAFLAVAVLPIGPTVNGWATQGFWWPLAWVGEKMGADLSRPLPLVITDLDIGLLFVIAISSLGVFAILLAGWASNSKYPLLGGLRSAAQLISYEVPLGFALVAGLMMTGTLSIPGIIDAQRNLGFSLFLLQPISLFLYFTSGIAETNRVPFDLPEAETELVAGFHTEYSGMKFALFFLAEYINMVTVSAIAAAVFLGGWLPPLHGLWTWVLGPGNGEPVWWMRWAFWAPMGMIWMLLKISILYYMYFWLRATLPRYRYDQLMRLGWKWLIPLSLANVFMVGVNVVLKETVFAGMGSWVYLPLMVANVLLVLIVVYNIRTAKDREREEARPALGIIH